MDEGTIYIICWKAAFSINVYRLTHCRWFKTHISEEASLPWIPTKGLSRISLRKIHEIRIWLKPVLFQECHNSGDLSICFNFNPVLLRLFSVFLPLILWAAMGSHSCKWSSRPIDISDGNNNSNIIMEGLLPNKSSPKIINLSKRSCTKKMSSLPFSQFLCKLSWKYKKRSIIRVIIKDKLFLNHNGWFS